MWLDVQMHVTFLWTQVKSWTLHDCTKTEWVLGYVKNNVQLPSVLRTDSNEILTSYAPVSFAVHPESSSHIGMCTLVHGSMLSLSSKHKNSEKGSLKTRLIGIYNIMMLDMSMRHFYMAVWYSYIANWLISGDIGRVVCKPIEVMESDCFTQAL